MYFKQTCPTFELILGDMEPSQISGVSFRRPVTREEVGDDTIATLKRHIKMEFKHNAGNRDYPSYTMIDVSVIDEQAKEGKTRLTFLPNQIMTTWTVGSNNEKIPFTTKNQIDAIALYMVNGEIAENFAWDIFKAFFINENCLNDEFLSEWAPEILKALEWQRQAMEKCCV